MSLIKAIPPDWLTTLVRKWMDRVGPYGWFYHTVWVRVVNNDEDAAGSCEHEAQYNRVMFEFADHLTDDDDTNGYVLHECLHAMHASIDNVVENIIIPQLPYELREMASAMYNLVNEQTIHELTKGLLDWEKEQGGKS